MYLTQSYTQMLVPLLSKNLQGRFRAFLHIHIHIDLNLGMAFCGLNFPPTVSHRQPGTDLRHVCTFSPSPSSASTSSSMQASLTTIDRFFSAHHTIHTKTRARCTTSLSHSTPQLPEYMKGKGLIRASVVRKEPAVDKTDVAVRVASGFGGEV